MRCHWWKIWRWKILPLRTQVPLVPSWALVQSLSTISCNGHGFCAYGVRRSVSDAARAWGTVWQKIIARVGLHWLGTHGRLFYRLQRSQNRSMIIPGYRIWATLWNSVSHWRTWTPLGTWISLHCRSRPAIICWSLDVEKVAKVDKVSQSRSQPFKR